MSTAETYVIKGVPRTKKNSQRIARRKNGVPFILQAKTANAWAKSAVMQLRVQHAGRGRAPWCMPVRLSARIYREKAVGDLLNYLAAVSDALEAANVVENDRLIVSLDGSQLLKDKHNPRVEIEIEELRCESARDQNAATTDQMSSAQRTNRENFCCNAKES